MDRETQKLVDTIAALGKGIDKATLNGARQLVDKRKPKGYDVWQKGVAERYSGNQREHIAAALVIRFPQTHEQMSRVGLNYLAMVGAQDAGVYTQPPERWLENADGDEVDDKAPDAVAFDKAIDQSGLDVSMGEMEIRTNVCGTGLMKGLWVDDDETAAGGRVSWPLYWPHEVGIAMHPLATDYTTLKQCVLLVAETASPDPAQVAYEVYSRTFDVANVAGTYGEWVRVVVTADGEIVVPTAPLVSRFPWVLAQVGMPSGSPWIETDKDLVNIVDDLNCDASAMRLAMDYGATPILNYYGTAVESTKLTIGPSSVNKLGPQERFEAVRVDPQLVEMGEQTDRMAKQLAITRSNSASAYAVDEGAPLSGVSRMIANIPHERRLARLAHSWRQVEDRQVLPIMLSLLREHSKTPITEGLFGRMTPTAPGGYEDETAKQDRVLALKLEGLIDAPDARVMLDLSETREDAEAYLLKMAGTAPLPGALTGSPFASTRETTATVTDDTP